MSTKASIAWGEDFHLYTDLLDEDAVVYLQISHPGCHHETTVAIPSDVWEYIRGFPGANLNLATASDADLQARVESEVDERIKDFIEAAGRNKGLVSFCGSAVYGLADKPREDQVAAGLAYYTAEREQQQEIAKKIKAHRTKHS